MGIRGEKCKAAEGPYRPSTGQNFSQLFNLRLNVQFFWYGENFQLFTSTESACTSNNLVLPSEMCNS